MKKHNAISFISGTRRKPTGHHGTYLSREDYQHAKGRYATSCYEERVTLEADAVAYMREHRCSYEAYLAAQANKNT